jgi:hypothetical protein
MTNIHTDANRNAADRAAWLLEQARYDSCAEGFYGTVTLTIRVQDGTWVHPEVTIDQTTRRGEVEEIHRRRRRST